MPPRPQRLVRRLPLRERIRQILNPMDFYLWLSEEIQTFDWDSIAFGTRFGLIANFLFLIARANTGGTREAFDDVFGDAPASGWFTLVANFLQWLLITISILNAFYAITRKRTYRLFEMSVESNGPGTPSAQRVRVDSTPSASTPVRLIQTILRPETADQRAHPDPSRDVWELRVWDPFPATLRMFCLFSPGHVLIHMLFLPLPTLDPRPSMTVFKCILLQVILSTQLWLFHLRFAQQAKDTAIIQREVMHEYDVKFVHPRLHPVYREVGTQVSISDGKIKEEDVRLGTPSTLIRRSFQPNPNPNYVRHIDPDGQIPVTRTTMSPTPLRPYQQSVSSNFFTPPKPPVNPFTPSKPTFAQHLRQTMLRQNAATTTTTSTGTSTTSTNTDPSTPSVTNANASTNKTPSFTSSFASTSTNSSFTTTQSTTSSQPTRVSQLSQPSLPPPSTAQAPGLGGSLGVYTHMNSPLKKRNPYLLNEGPNGGYVGSPRNSREMAALEQRELAERMIRQSSPGKKDRHSHITTTGAQGGSQSGEESEQENSRVSGGNNSFAHSPEKLARLRANRWTQERFPTRKLP